MRRQNRIERWGQWAGELGRVLGKQPDAVSRWARMAGLHRAEDPALAKHREAVDRALAAATCRARASCDDNVGSVRPGTNASGWPVSGAAGRREEGFPGGFPGIIDR